MNPRYNNARTLGLSERFHQLHPPVAVHAFNGLNHAPIMPQNAACRRVLRHGGALEIQQIGQLQIQVNDILTERQRRAWRSMTGDPLDLPPPGLNGPTPPPGGTRR